LPWSDRAFRLLPALLLLLVAACGPDLQPYRGRPGGAAWLLAQPPAYRIAIPPAQAVLLSDKAAGQLASILAEALRDAEVPAVATVPLPLDWPLSISMERQGSQVLPRYELRDADGTQLGIASGKPIPLNDWGTEAPPLLKQVVTRDAPAIAALLANVEAARKASDPAALAGRGPLRIRLAGVKGAPGDGNNSLKNSIESSLSKLGLVPQDVAEGASYAVQGEVHMVAMADNQQRVEIQWIVTRRDGEELGRVLQMNVVPKNTLNGLWGDVAFVVAEEAAGGIRQVLRNATNTNPDHPAPGATPAAAPGGTPAAVPPPPPPPGGRP
jgi:hypothetical protein